jgi:uncharacterized protein (DUF433 family)
MHQGRPRRIGHRHVPRRRTGSIAPDAVAGVLASGSRTIEPARVARYGWERRYVNMADLDRITSHPDVMLGKPVVTGTRITVEHILDELAAGTSLDDLLRAHPRLSREDVHAALSFAAESVRMEQLRQITVA